MSEISQIPENLQILNVDYDSNIALREKYGVTSQHTFVLVDRNGNKIKSIQGLNHISELINFVGPELLNAIPQDTTSTGDIDLASGDIVTISSGKTETIEPSNTQQNITTTTETVKVTNNTTTPSNTNTKTTPTKETTIAKGIYTTYESGKKYITDPSKKVVLFFHASRCPNCRQAEADILVNKDNIDANLVILNVDYDTAKELKKQHGITTQTSYVIVNTDGTTQKKSVGFTTLSQIEKFAQ
jgi:thioredoxin-related protein